MADEISASERDAIEAACCRLVRAFCHCSDAGDPARYEALFTTDARFSRPGQELVGVSAIGAALRERPADQLVRHMCMDPVVEIVDADHAHGAGTLLVVRFDRASGTAAQPVWGDYRDQYRQVEGEWRIAARDVTLSFPAP